MTRWSARGVMLRNALVAALVIGVGLTLSHAATPPYHIILFKTDDQRWDTVERVIDGQPVMQNVRDKLIRHPNGITFSNAFVSTPLCCPDRVSLLAGGYYAHNTGVLTNEWPNGGARKFREVDLYARPPKLQAAGYKTALIGKYLNGFDELVTGPAAVPDPVPPGWTYFNGTVKHPRWSDFTVFEGNSTATAPGYGTEQHILQYITDYQRDRALDFLRNNAASSAPLFLVFSTHAPHAPATPAPQDATLFPGFQYRERGWCEDVTDKPQWVRQQAHPCDPNDVAEEDAFHRDQLRSLQAVDRAIAAIINELDGQGKLPRTILIFTSDNGYLWLEHRLTAKGKPYEEAIRVPLVIVQPGVVPRSETRPVVANLDLGATIPVWAGLPLDPETDGRNLVPLLETPASTPWRSDWLLEFFGKAAGGGQGVWAALRTTDDKYVEYGASGEAEFYALGNDPFELTNAINEPAYSNVIASRRASLTPLKGLAITTPLPAPQGQEGEPYSFTLRAWGGMLPYTWSWRVAPNSGGTLPQGLVLEPSVESTSATIRGTPTLAGSYGVWVEVQDSSQATFTNHWQAYILEVTLTIVDNN